MAKDVELINMYKQELAVQVERLKKLNKVSSKNDECLKRNIIFIAGILFIGVTSVLISLFTQWSYVDVIMQAALFTGIHKVYKNHTLLKELDGDLKNTSIHEVNERIKTLNNLIDILDSK